MTGKPQIGQGPKSNRSDRSKAKLSQRLQELGHKYQDWEAVLTQPPAAPPGPADREAPPPPPANHKPDKTEGNRWPTEALVQTLTTLVDHWFQAD